MLSKEEFQKYIVKSVKNLPREEQMKFIDGIVEAVKDSIEELELGMMEIKRAKMPSSNMIKDLLKGALTGQITKLEGAKLEAFLEMLKSNGIERTDSSNHWFDGDSETEKEFKERSVRDFAEKKVGDSIVVVSKHVANYMHDFDTEQQLSKDFERPLKTFVDTPAIVIEVGTEFNFNCGHCDEEHKSDIVIYFPSLDKKYHISSKLVKLL